eukprot:82685_1
MSCILKFKHSSFINIATFFVLLFQYTTIASQNADDYVYVSKDGTNRDNCGSTISPCGTFYYASTLLDHLNNITTIYIIDGQNETEIQLYINNIKKYSSSLYEAKNNQNKLLNDDKLDKSKRKTKILEIKNNTLNNNI